MFEIFKKKEAEKVVKVAELTADDKFRVDEFLEDNLKPSEIAERMGLDIKSVYNHVDLKKRRIERQAVKLMQPIPSDPIKEARARIELQDLEYQLQAKREKQALELEKLRIELDIKRAELNAVDEDYNEASEDELPGLFPFLAQLLQKQGQSVGNIPPQSAKPATNTQTQENILKVAPDVLENNQAEMTKGSVGVSGQTTLLSMQGDLSDEQIKQILMTIEQNHAGALSIGKYMPKKKLFEFVKQRMPDLSDNSINRGIEILKKGEV